MAVLAKLVSLAAIKILDPEGGRLPLLIPGDSFTMGARRGDKLIARSQREPVTEVPRHGRDNERSLRQPPVSMSFWP